MVAYKAHNLSGGSSPTPATKFYKSIWKKEVRHLEKSAESTNEIESSSSTLTLAIRTPLAGKRYPSLNRDSQKDIKATCGQLK